MHYAIYFLSLRLKNEKHKQIIKYSKIRASILATYIAFRADAVLYYLRAFITYVLKITVPHCPELTPVKWNSAFIFPAINISGFPFNEPTSELIYVDRCRLLFTINYANENAGKFICHLRLIVAPAGGTCCGSIRLRIGYAGEIESYPIL